MPRPIGIGRPSSRLRVFSSDSICGSRSKFFAIAPMELRILCSP